MGAASLKSGADISHIFCAKDAGIPIKSYSPELIVHPCLEKKEEVLKWLDACTSLVIGPGLGRDEETALIIQEVIDKIIYKNLEIPVVGDADFLWFLSNSHHLIDSVSKL